MGQIPAIPPGQHGFPKPWAGRTDMGSGRSITGMAGHRETSPPGLADIKAR
jgi:hypothetical protein